MTAQLDGWTVQRRPGGDYLVACVECPFAVVVAVVGGRVDRWLLSQVVAHQSVREGVSHKARVNGMSVAHKVIDVPGRLAELSARERLRERWRLYNRRRRADGRLGGRWHILDQQRGGEVSHAG